LQAILSYFTAENTEKILWNTRTIFTTNLIIFTHINETSWARSYSYDIL